MAIAVLAWLVLSTWEHFRKVNGKVFITSIIGVLAVTAFVLIGDYKTEILVTYGVLAASFVALLILGMGSEELDKDRYYSNEFTFSKYALKQFKKNKFALISVYLLGALSLTAIYAPYIATNQPFYAEYHGKKMYPAYQSILQPTYTDSVETEQGMEYIQFDIAEWKQMKLDKAVWAPFAYNNTSGDYLNPEKSPFGKQRYKNPDGEFVDMPGKFRHRMGTNQTGLDVASGIIHGTRISLTIGFISMGIATLLGILLGALAGFYGDNRLKVTRLKFWFTVLSIAALLFYIFIAKAGWLGVIIAAVVWLLGHLISKPLHGGFFGKMVNVPIDNYVMRSIEILRSIPRLVIIITIAAMVKRPSFLLLMVIIGATSWTGIARLTRAEFLRTRSLDFIQAAKSLGFKDTRIIFKHALPNSMAPVFVAIAFGIASAILIEASLSFLGIGVPEDVTTWGSLLNQGRENFELKWLVLIPGFFIFITVTVYNLIGDALRDALDPKLKK